MFDFAWSEIALIGVVALVLIGPKDLPVAIKAVSDVVKKMRRMAGEFQSQVDEMVKDTSLAEVRQQINEIRNLDIRGEIEKAVDADGSIRSTFAEDPFRNVAGSTGTPAPTYVPPAGSHSIEAPPDADAAHDPAHGWDSPAFEAPAFVPPGTKPPVSLAAPAALPPEPPPPEPPPPEPPAFMPPGLTPPAAPPA
jgi:sec-independent protein translocase protein TatB